jgi:MOSC domain-containing protein YiiM
MQASSGRTGFVDALNLSDGGVPKHAVPEARIEALGLVGDVQLDTRHHGGPDRAVCLYSREVIDGLRREGHPIDAGTAGENLTLAGLDWVRVVPGSRLRIGSDVELEITRYTTPCKTIRGSFTDEHFQRILQDDHPGESRVYARVLRTGTVRAGDPVALFDPVAPPPASAAAAGPA